MLAAALGVVSAPAATEAETVGEGADAAGPAVAPSRRRRNGSR